MAKSKNVIVKTSGGDWPLTKKESFVQVKNTSQKKSAIKRGGRSANERDDKRVKAAGKNFTYETSKEGRKQGAKGKTTKHREKINRMSPRGK